MNKPMSSDDRFNKCLADILAAGRKARKVSIIEVAAPSESDFAKLSNGIKN